MKNPAHIRLDHLSQQGDYTCLQGKSFFCVRATKRCVKRGKNSKKHTGNLLDKLEFVTLL